MLTLGDARTARLLDKGDPRTLTLVEEGVCRGAGHHRLERSEDREAEEGGLSEVRLHPREDCVPSADLHPQSSLLCSQQASPSRCPPCPGGGLCRHLVLPCPKEEPWGQPLPVERPPWLCPCSPSPTLLSLGAPQTVASQTLPLVWAPHSGLLRMGCLSVAPWDI